MGYVNMVLNTKVCYKIKVELTIIPVLFTKYTGVLQYVFNKALYQLIQNV